MARKGVFGSDGLLAHKLWVDEPNAHEIRSAKLARNEISAEESERLTQFIDEGYCTLDLGLSSSFCDDFAGAIDNLWENRSPAVMAASAKIGTGRPVPIVEVEDSPPRSPGIRLLDSHSADELIESLYLHPLIHQTIRAIYDETPVATQSLLFEYGSTQSLHRDPWFVVTTPVANLTAVWIALEDIDDQSGPLTYVPGSHRLPHYKFSTNDLVFHDPAVSNEERKAAGHFMTTSMSESGLEEKRFIAKKGQAFIWHSGLVHGGSVVDDGTKTRRSLVVHFDKLKDHRRQGVTVTHLDGTSAPIYTTRVIEKNGCHGFEAPTMQLKEAKGLPQKIAG